MPGLSPKPWHNWWPRTITSAWRSTSARWPRFVPQSGGHGGWRSPWRWHCAWLSPAGWSPGGAATWGRRRRESWAVRYLSCARARQGPLVVSRSRSCNVWRGAWVPERGTKKSLGLKVVRIEQGTFVMGSGDAPTSPRSQGHDRARVRSRRRRWSEAWLRENVRGRGRRRVWGARVGGVPRLPRVVWQCWQCYRHSPALAAIGAHSEGGG
jgi:hypothetical protein